MPHGKQESTGFEIVIEADRINKGYWLDLWRYRELFYFLAWRDILLRYKQTVFGIAWALLRPLATMLVLTFVFSKIARLASGETPYYLFVLAAMLPWQLFVGSLNDASHSLIDNENMITKVYFPRVIIPLSSIIVNLLDVLISFGVLLILLLISGRELSWQIVTLPAFALLAVGLCAGCGLWLSALNVRYRDFRYIIPFVLQFGLYVSPVGYSTSEVPQRWQLLTALNPMTGIIEGCRYALFGVKSAFFSPAILISVLVTLAILYSGLRYFRGMERGLADVI